MKKIILESTAEEPYDIFAILSPLKSYIIAHHINEKYGYDLCRHEEDMVYESKTKTSHHPIFSYTLPDNLNRVYLIGNKGDLPLIQERKEMDYLLVMKGEQSIADLKVYIEMMRTIRGVQYIDYMNSQKIKSLQNHPLGYLP